MLVTRFLRFTSIRCHSNAIFISPQAQIRPPLKATPLFGVKVLTLHDGALVHLALKSLQKFGAEIVDLPFELNATRRSKILSGKFIDDETQIQRNILMNVCRKMDLLIESYPKGASEQNVSLNDHFMSNNPTMVIARFASNLNCSLQGKLHTFHDAIAQTAHLQALATCAISSIAMALYNAQRIGYGTVVDINAEYMSQQFPNLYDVEGGFRRFYKTSDDKWVFVGSIDLKSLTNIFRKLGLVFGNDATDEQISAAFAEALHKRSQHYWIHELAESQVISV